MRSNTICNYFAAISVADFVHSFMQYAIMITSAVSRSSFMLAAAMVCGTVHAVLVISGSISSQLLTILCCERFIVVRFPFQSREWLSSRISRICIFVVVFLNSIYILPNSVFISHDVANTYGRFVPICTMKRTPVTYIVVISVLYSLLPLLVITLMNILLIRELVMNIDRLKAINLPVPIVERRVQDTKKALPVVIAVCIVLSFPLHQLV